MKSLLKFLWIIFIATICSDIALAQRSKDIQIINAVQEGNIDTIKQLAEEGINLRKVKDKKGRNLLFSVKDWETAQFLIDEGVNINAVDEERDTPLISIIKNRVKNGPRFDKHISDKSTVIYGEKYQEEYESNFYRLVKALVDGNADVNSQNSKGESPLSWSAWGGLNNEVDLLLANKANPNIKNNDGRTPLLFAVASGTNKIVDHLLKYGASPNFTDPLGNSPLLSAISDKNNEAVKNLLKNGANPSLITKLHIIPLHYATFKNYSNIVKDLLRRGANPNLRDKHFGETALHFAVKNDNAEIINALLAKGAKKDIVDYENKRPVAYSLSEKIVSRLGKDDFVMESEKTFNNRTKITSSFDYSKLWPKDVSVLFIGERHYIPQFKTEVAKLIKKFKKSGIKITDYASEFITKREQSVMDVFQYTPLPIEKFAPRIRLGDSRSNIYETAKKKRVKIIGLDIGDTPADWATLAKGMKERNNQWVNILTGILEKNSNAKILVYCGSGHSDYGAYKAEPVSTLLQKKKIKGKNIEVKVVILTAPGAYEHTANGYTAKRLNLLNEYFVAPVPDDKAKLIGADFIINVPKAEEEPSIPRELLRPITLPW